MSNSFCDKWLDGSADKRPTKNVRILHIDKTTGKELLTGIMPRKSAEKYLDMYHLGKIVDDDNGGN